MDCGRSPLVDGAGVAAPALWAGRASGYWDWCQRSSAAARLDPPMPVCTRQGMIAFLCSRFSRYKILNLQVHLPKFRIESTHDLVEPLKALGITDVFDPQLADLSGIVNQGKPSLWVSKVVQKAFIVVCGCGLSKFPNCSRISL
jgi:hypothetical protein